MSETGGSLLPPLNAHDGVVVAPATPSTSPQFPYPGLRAFTPADAAYFFGREVETDALLRRLSDPESRLIAVIGRSGVGKSSLIGAGLLLRLAAQAEGGAAWLLPAYEPATGRWSGLRFTPGARGDNPFVALAAQLAPMLGADEHDLATRLADDPPQIISRIARLLSGRPAEAEALVIIDQFEELFVLSHERYLPAFMALLTALAAPEGRARVILALRGEFYSHATGHPELATLLATSGFALSAPTTTALRAIITEPAARAGLRFEEGLVDRLLKDAGDARAGLPALAFTLAEWVRSGAADGLLTRRQYDSLGGLQRAIDARAEAAFGALDAEAQAELPRLLSELAEVDEYGHVIPRRTNLNRAGRTRPARRLVDALCAAGLLLTDSGAAIPSAASFGAAAPQDDAALEKARELSGDLGINLARPVTAGAGSSVEVAHEAVLHQWERASRWIDTAGDDLRLLRQVRRGTEDWTRSNYDAAHLLTGTRLERAREWLSGGVLTALQHDFVSASAKADDERRATERGIARRVEMMTRARNGLLGVVVLATLAIAGAGLALLNVDSRQRESEAARERLSAQIGDLVATSANVAGQVNDSQQTLTRVAQTQAVAQLTAQGVETASAQVAAAVTAATPIPLTLTAMGEMLTTAQAEATTYALARLSAGDPSDTDLATAEVLRVALLALTASPTPNATQTAQSLFATAVARDLTRAAQTPSATRTPTRATATVTPTPSVTATPDRTLAAVASNPAPEMGRTYAPVSGTLVHDASDTFVVVYEIDARPVDFILDARFYNPYPSSENAWDYGIFFRVTTPSQYRLAVNSGRFWSLDYVENSTFTTIQNGYISSADFDNSDGASNDLRLIVRGSAGYFYANDAFVAELDLGRHRQAGNVQIVTGAYQGNEITGEVTRFEDATLRELSGPPIPTATPSITPVPAGEAQIGENTGRITVGGGQRWTYAGEAGEILRIAVEAERPASERDGQERDPDGFDTLVIVYSPNGARLIEDDDIRDGVITNSLIERVRLPQAGTYVIEVRSWADQSGGDYVLIIESDR